MNSGLNSDQFDCGGKILFLRMILNERNFILKLSKNRPLWPTIPRGLGCLPGQGAPAMPFRANNVPNRL